MAVGHSFLVQLLLPLRDNEGTPFPRLKYQSVTCELTSRFGGVTAYTRAPAEGRWHDGTIQVDDDVIVIEVMVETLDRSWWRAFRETQERAFRQDEIILRALPLQLL